MFNFSKVDTVHLLNKIKENILVADEDYTIVFINQSAKQLLAEIGPYIGIKNPENFIGMNIQQFHGPKQHQILVNGPFPHSATITLFNKFSARIVVERLQNQDGSNNGFILTWKDVTEFEEAIQENLKQIQVLDMPVIPLSVDAAVLIPIMGKLTEDRLSLMEEKVLSHVAASHNEFVIFDFTGVLDELDAASAFRLQQAVNALKLMGTKAIYVGIRPEMAKSIVLDGLQVNVPTFNSFVHGIRYVWKKTGYKLVKD